MSLFVGGTLVGRNEEAKPLHTFNVDPDVRSTVLETMHFENLIVVISDSAVDLIMLRDASDNYFWWSR